MYQQEPLVSVIMPVYNSEKYLSLAIRSIINQTYREFELLIISDGSSDNSPNIIKEYVETDSRIRIIDNGANRGLVYSLNKGIEESKGKYVAIMHADDISLPERFEIQVDYLEQNEDISLLGTNVRYLGTLDISRMGMGPDMIKVMFMGLNMLYHPTMMMRRKDIIDKKLRYKDFYFSAEDFKMWTDAVVSGLKIANLSDVLLEYRIHDSQITSVYNSKQNQLAELIKKEYINDLLGDVLSEKDIDIIFNRFDPSSDKSDVDKLRLIEKLKAYNREQKVFNNKIFRKYLGHKRRVITRSKNRTNLLGAASGIKHKMWITRLYFLKMIENILNLK